MQVGIEVVWTVDSDADQFIIAEAKTLRTLGAPKASRHRMTSCMRAALLHGWHVSLSPAAGGL